MNNLLYSVVVSVLVICATVLIVHGEHVWAGIFLFLACTAGMKDSAKK